MARYPGEKNGCHDIEACITPLETSAYGVAVVDACPSVVAVLEEQSRGAPNRDEVTQVS